MAIINQFQSRGIDTSDASAAAADIEEGKTAYVNGMKVTGALPVVELLELPLGSVFGPGQDYEFGADVYDGNIHKLILDKYGSVVLTKPKSYFGDALASDVAVGKTFTSASGVNIAGTAHIASTSSIIFSTNGFIEHPDEFSSEAAVMLASTQDTVALSDCGGNCYVLSLFPLLTEASTLSVKKSDGSIGQIELSVTRGSPLAVFHVASKGNATKLKDYVSAFVFGSIDTQSIITV